MKKKRLLFLPVLFMLLLVVLSVTVHAEGTNYTVKISGIAGYETAHSMMTDINELRSSVGAPALSYDTQLSEIAMQRAAECAIYYSHTRPDGSSWNSIYPYHNGGENIAIRYDSAQEVFEGWKNSSGHYKNMVNPDFKKIGIASFYNNGFYTWVQVFSGDASTGSTVYGDRKFTTTVKVSEYLAGKYFLTRVWDSDNGGGGSVLDVGSSTRLAAGIVNRLMNCEYALLDSDSFLWSSVDSSIVRMVQDGTATGVTWGDTSVRAVPKTGGSAGASYNFTIRYNLGNAEMAALPAVLYNGSAHTPEPVVTYKGTRLTKNVDYTVTYMDNIESGTASVIAAGMGKYAGKCSKSFTIEKLADMSKLEAHLNGDGKVTGNVRNYVWDNIYYTYDGKTVDKSSYSLMACGNNELSYFQITLRGNYIGGKTFYYVGAAYTPGISDQTYTGKALCPTLKLYRDYNAYTAYNPQMMVPGTDYTVTWKNNVAVGTATAVITGKGNFFGQLAVNFKIVAPKPAPKPTATPTPKPTATPTPKPAKKVTLKTGSITKLTSTKAGTLTVSYKKDTKASGYQIEYSRSKNFKSVKRLTVKKNTTLKQTIKKLTRKKTWYVRVRSYKKSKYGKWSKVKKILVK